MKRPLTRYKQAYLVYNIGRLISAPPLPLEQKWSSIYPLTHLLTKLLSHSLGQKVSISLKSHVDSFMHLEPPP